MSPRPSTTLAELFTRWFRVDPSSAREVARPRTHRARPVEKGTASPPFSFPARVSTHRTRKIGSWSRTIHEDQTAMCIAKSNYLDGGFGLSPDETGEVTYNNQSARAFSCATATGLAS